MPIKHWKLKAILQKLIWNTPGGVQLNTFVSMLSNGHDPQKELLQKHAPNFVRHLLALRVLGLSKFENLTILEIGTGWDINIAIMFSLCGFKEVVTVDAFRHVKLNQVKKCLELFDRVIPELAEISPKPVEQLTNQIQILRNENSLEGLCNKARIRYIAPISTDYAEISDNSIDLCYSTAVFEHIRPEDIKQILKNTHSKIKNTGYSSHIIDLKDHFAYFQKGLSYNHFLTLSSAQWEFWASNPLAYTNRLSTTEWRNLFKEENYEFLQFAECEEKNLLSIPKQMLHKEQQYRTDDDLKIGEVHVIARPKK